jgi:hypothetical protein
MKFCINRISGSAENYFIPFVILMMIIFPFSANSSFSTDSSIFCPIKPRNMILTRADDNSIIDILTCTNINIFLKVPSSEIYKKACLWSKIIAIGDPALREIKRMVLLPTGVTGGFFRAIRPGLVQLRSSRYDCSSGINVIWHVNIWVK